MTAPLRPVSGAYVPQNQELYYRTPDSENTLLTWLVYVLQNSQGAAENLDTLAVLAKRVPQPEHIESQEVLAVIETVKSVAEKNKFDDTLKEKVERAIKMLSPSGLCSVERSAP